MADQRLTELEEQLAHLQKVTEELSDIVALQGAEFQVVSKRLAVMMQREAERELDSGGSVPVADQKPPHW